MKPAAFDYQRIASADEACDVLARMGDDARILAGGQSLMAVLNMRLAQPQRLLDISRCAPLQQMRAQAGALRVGAAVTQAALEWRPGLAQELPLLRLQKRIDAVLLTDRDQPAWLVEADRAGIRLASLNTRPAPPDRVLELWALPQGATAPTSLGLIPADGRITVRPATITPTPGMLIEITLEPPGGSPIGRPTGPIQFIGRLAPATGS
jgi:anti-sigma-K factor RskA